MKAHATCAIVLFGVLARSPSVVAQPAPASPAPPSPSTPDASVTAVAKWIKSEDCAAFDMSMSEHSDDPDDHEKVPKITGSLIVHEAGLVEFQLSSTYRIMRDRLKTDVTFFKKGEHVAMKANDGKWAALNVPDFAWVNVNSPSVLQIQQFSDRVKSVFGSGRNDYLVGVVAQRTMCLVDPRRIVTVEEVTSEDSSRKANVRREGEARIVSVPLTTERARALDAFNDGMLRLQPQPQDRTEGSVAFMLSKDSAITSITLELRSYYHDGGSTIELDASGAPVIKKAVDRDAKPEPPLCVTREVVFGNPRKVEKSEVPEDVRKTLLPDHAVK
jgi:hypothetical protein